MNFKDDYVGEVVEAEKRSADCCRKRSWLCNMESHSLFFSKKKVYLMAEKNRSECRVNTEVVGAEGTWFAETVKEGANEKEDHVRSAVVLCFEKNASAVLDEEAVESMGAVGRRKVSMTTDGRILLLNCCKDDVGMLEDEGADGEEIPLEVGGADCGREGFRPETYHGCELDELVDSKVNVLEGLVGKDVVKAEVRGDFVERMGLRK